MKIVQSYEDYYIISTQSSVETEVVSVEEEEE